MITFFCLIASFVVGYIAGFLVCEKMNGKYQEGTVSNIKIHDRTFSAAEIKEAYNQSV